MHLQIHQMFPKDFKEKNPQLFSISLCDTGNGTALGSVRHRKEDF